MTLNSSLKQKLSFSISDEYIYTHGTGFIGGQLAIISNQEQLKVLTVYIYVRLFKYQYETSKHYG